MTDIGEGRLAIENLYHLTDDVPLQTSTRKSLQKRAIMGMGDTEHSLLRAIGQESWVDIALDELARLRPAEERFELRAREAAKEQWLSRHQAQGDRYMGVPG